MTRLLRPVSDPLGSYLRVGRRDHVFLAQMLVDGRPVGTGLIADPSQYDRHKDLWAEARLHGVETVLDPRSLELSTPGGFERAGVQDLPWAAESIHTPDALFGQAGEDLCDQLVDMVMHAQHSAVLAPTHYVGPGRDPWLDIDHDLTFALREALNRAGLRNVPIYYPLISKSDYFYDAAWRTVVTGYLHALPIDAIWLRIHPFGTGNSGPLALKRYLAAARDLHELGKPVVGEHTGAVGVGLMAFGAIGGIESGITVIDHTNLTDWLRKPHGRRGGGHEARVYLPDLGAFLDRSKADALMARPGMKAAHSCRDSHCCARGWGDTRVHYREHFVHQRSREVSAMSAIPEPLRPGSYLETFLRPATDKAIRAAAAEPALASTRRRLESWRGTFSSDLAASPIETFSPPAAGARYRKSA